MDRRPLKVFLCHASADKPKVHELYRTLKRRGVQPWLDAEDLIPGQNWEMEIPKALLSSDAIIICLTPNSVDKEGYVQKEIKFALDKTMEMPEGRIFIIPARLEECDLPFSLKKFHAVDLYEKTGYTKLMQALKLRASQLERATVQLPKAGEANAEIEKIVEEKKSREPKEEKPEIKTPKPSQDKVGVGGDVQDSVIVSGSGNVINIGEQKKPEPEKPKPRTTKPPSKPNTAIIVAIIGLVGTLCAALISSPMLVNLFSRTPEPTAIASTLTETKPPSPAKTPTKVVAPTQFFTPTATPFPTEITDSKGVTMRLVPAGEFIMGDDSTGYRDRDADQNPTHDVYLTSFYMDMYEVTNFLYQKCVDSSVCTRPSYSSSNTRPQYYGNPEFSNYPVLFVNWYQAATYCEWRGARLPTEAEWEKAARGTDGRYYPWGPQLFVEDAANHSGVTNTQFGDTTEVGSYPLGVSPYGIYDMAGNVWEWVNDWYQSDYYAIYGDSAVNPQGPENGESKVLRGGSWFSGGWIEGAPRLDDDISTFNRYRDYPSRFYFDYGFRCAKDSNP